MRRNQVEAFIPESVMTEGKCETADNTFFSSLAVLDATDGGQILAARGLGTNYSSNDSFFQQQLPSLLSAMKVHNRAAILTERGVLIAFGDLLPYTGLLPVILPHGAVSSVTWALIHLERDDLFIDPAILKVTKRFEGDLESLERLQEEFFLFDRIFRAGERTDFRLHCAHIAHLAGCRSDVTALPLGNLSMGREDWARWTAFLLCCFLSLRGESAEGTLFHLESATVTELRMQMEHRLERSTSILTKGNSFAFLLRPCFSDFAAFKTDRGVRFEAVLHRKTSANLLCSSPMVEYLSVEITTDAESDFFFSRCFESQIQN